MLVPSVSADSVPIACIRSVVRGIEVGRAHGVGSAEGVTNLSSWILDDKTQLHTKDEFCGPRKRLRRTPNARCGYPSLLA